MFINASTQGQDKSLNGLMSMEMMWFTVYAVAFTFRELHPSSKQQILEELLDR